MAGNLSKAEFMELFNSGASQKAQARGTVDWEVIIDDCKAVHKQTPFTVKDFWYTYVKGEVSEGRTRAKLDQLYAQGRLWRVKRPEANYYMWSDEELV